MKPMRNGLAGAAAVAVLVMGLGACAPETSTPSTTTVPPREPSTTRITMGHDGAEANGTSGYPKISEDGRFVAFGSAASNLVDDDTNGTSDIFVHDRQTGVTERVSVASDGTEANRSSQAASMSADGRYVTFYSSASNLVPDDTNNTEDVFIHDRQTGITELVSYASDGTQGNAASLSSSVSDDGRYVAFASRATNLVSTSTTNDSEIYVRDRVAGTTRMVSVASDGTLPNGSSWNPRLSGNGGYVAFSSMASNLVADDTNDFIDVFVHDLFTGNTQRVSVASDGTEGNSATTSDSSISTDGRYVGFSSYSSNLVPNDTNHEYDAFVHDRVTGVTERFSVATDGTQADRSTMATEVSPDGRYVGFYTAATNLVPGDTNDIGDVFIHDRVTGVTERVSVATDGTEGDGPSLRPSISADGRIIAFWSFATNLVPDDTNGYQEIFVRDRGA